MSSDPLLEPRPHKSNEKVNEPKKHRTNKEKNMAQLIKQAKAIRSEMKFDFQGQSYSIPYVIEERFIIDSQLCQGGFGCIF